jgi:hypothetical protein
MDAHHDTLRLARVTGLVCAGLLALGLAACATPGAGGANGIGPGGSPSPDTGVGTVGALPEEEAPSPPPPTPSPITTLTLAPQVLQAVPAPIDCVSYNPANLSVVAFGDAWRLQDGNHYLKLFDTKADADDGLKVARNWKQFCFIGRGNDEEDKYRYIKHWWREPSGLPLGPAPTFDCITYNPATLKIYSGGSHPANPTEDDWALFSGGIPLLFLSTEPDALRAKIVASGNTRLCVIGADNTRPDPHRYRLYFWRQ